jgi:DNA-binding transcriptional LysR family regulator
MGVQIFDRQRSGVEPTEMGLVVLSHARKLIQVRQDLEHELLLAQNLETGHLSIGVGPYGAASLIAPVIAKLCRNHPKLQVDLRISAWRELPEQLRDHQIDAMVSDVREVEQLNDLQVDHLSKHPVFAVCRPGHPVLKNKAPTLQQTLAFAQAGPSMPTQLFRAQRAPEQMFNIVCDSASVLKTLVMQSDAISFMAPFMVQEEVNAGQLVLLQSARAKPEYRFGITQLKSRSPSRVMTQFVTLLKQHDAQFNAA